jgi:hypothetical protein
LKMKSECKLLFFGVYVDVISRVYLRQQLRRNAQATFSTPVSESSRILFWWVWLSWNEVINYRHNDSGTSPSIGWRARYVFERSSSAGRFFLLFLSSVLPCTCWESTWN